MKKLHLFAMALALGTFVACGDGDSGDGHDTDTTHADTHGGDQAGEAATYDVDEGGATVMWYASKDAGAHFGTIGLADGKVKANDQMVTGGQFEFDVNGVTVLGNEAEGDMGEGAGKLAGHLKSEDFFDAANHPNATLKITGSEKYNGQAVAMPEGLPADFAAMWVENPTHTIKGTFTVKGEAHDISFPAHVTMQDGSMTGKATFSIDRREYGLRFKSDTESTVHPEIWITVNFGADEV